MSRPGSYQPLPSPGEDNSGVDISYNHGIPEKTPLTRIEPVSRHSSRLSKIWAAKANEEPKIALHHRIWPLLLSFVIHLIPMAASIGIVSLSIFQVYWFDNDSQTNKIPWKIFRGRVSLNELLNCLQFVAKVHEILLVGSLSAMVMHRVRNRLLGHEGITFGLLTAGYSVGSAEYLLSGAFRSGFNRKFWLLSLLIIAFTALANTLGPASAIVLVPNLDWWSMKNPFGNESLPVVFNMTKEDWWPLVIDYNNFYANDLYNYSDICSTDLAFESYYCPSSGWNELMSWTVANSNSAVPANVSMDDQVSDAQRIVMSRLTERRNSSPGVAITTSLSQSFLGVMGGFWEQVQSRDYPVNQVLRPKLEPLTNQTIFQPMVQVHCQPQFLDDIQKSTNRNQTTNSNYDLNTFSTKSAPQLPIPDWLYNASFDYPTMSYPQMINFTWLNYSSQPDYNLSLAAVVLTPAVVNQESKTLVHMCSIDARWVGSSPAYDPSEETVVTHNLTDPLIFRRPENSDAGKYTSDMTRWAISPALSLTEEWVSQLSIPARFDTGDLNITGDSLQWMLSSYVITNSTFDSDLEDGGYMFNPGVNAAKNTTVLADVPIYTATCAETVATNLGLLITDGLARVNLLGAESGDIVLKHMNSANVTIAALWGNTGLMAAKTQLNDTSADIAESGTTSYLFKVSRYGYGYGFHTATVYFGAIILLGHSLITVIYILYALYDYIFLKRWTSSAWRDIGELIALLINSKPTAELQDTCAGIDSKYTWRKRVAIREVDDNHLGVVVGREVDLAQLPQVRVGVAYGTLDTNGSAGGLRKRRQSI